MVFYKNKYTLMVLVCIIATFFVGCTNNQDVIEVDNVTPAQDVAINTDVMEEVELLSTINNGNYEDAHELYHEFLEYIADLINYSTLYMLDLDRNEESQKYYQKLQENKFHNVSSLGNYMSNRMGQATDFNYVFLDVDNNGIDELFLLENERLVELFHIVDGEIKSVITSSGWKIFAQLRNDLTFFEYIDGSNGEYSFLLYEFIDNELILTNCYAARTYNSIVPYLYNLPAIDGEILFFNESGSYDFLERDDLTEYILDEQGEEEFNAMFTDRYEFDTVYPVEN